MNVLDAYMDHQDDRHRVRLEADDAWLRARAGIDPEERRRSWHRWLTATLEKGFQWPEAADRKTRLIHQCAAEVEVMVRQLFGRGWLLDGDALATHVQACLRPISEAQRAGRIGDFWPYFCHAVRAYVGANAEELQQEAKRTGADVAAQSVGAVLAGLGITGARQARPESLTEVVAARPAPQPAKRPRGRPSKRLPDETLPLL